MSDFEFSESSSSPIPDYEPPEGEVPASEVLEFEGEVSSSIIEFFVSPYSPHEIEVDNEGKVWFSDFEFSDPYANWIGRLDPETKKVKVWKLPYGTRISRLRVWQGKIWIVLRTGPDLVRFDPEKETFKYFRVPYHIGSWPFDIDFDKEGFIWMTVTVGRAVVKFDPKEERYVFYFRIPKGHWTAWIGAEDGYIWVSETFFGKWVFLYEKATGKIIEISPPEEFAHKFLAYKFHIVEGGILASLYPDDELGYLKKDESFRRYKVGERTIYIGYREEDKSVWGGMDDYIFHYSLEEERIKKKYELEKGSDVKQLYVDGRGDVWATLRGRKVILKIPKVVGCDKTCGGGVEDSSLIPVGKDMSVNLVSGNLFLSIPLIAVFDEFSLGLSIFYNSLDHLKPGVLGFGWTHNYNMRMEERGGDIYLRFQDGKVIKFKLTNDVYKPEPFAGSPMFVGITKVLDGYELVLKGGALWKFDSDGKLSYIKWKGRKWEFIYNGNLLYEVKNPIPRSMKFTYDENKMLKSIEYGPIKYEFYYSNGFLKSIKDPLDNFVHFEYTKNLLSEYTDLNGFKWKVDYEDGKVISVLDSNLMPFSIAYVGPEEMEISDRTSLNVKFKVRKDIVAWTEIVDVSGITIKKEYDELGNKILLIDPQTFETKYEYDEFGNLIRRVDALGNDERWEYDFNHLVKSHTDKLSRITRFLRDENGNVIKKIDPAGNEWTYTYNELSLLTEEINPLGAKTRYFYDEFGHLKRKIDALGNVWEYEYDILGRIIKEIDPKGSSKTYTYDPLGRVLEKKDPLGNVIRYSYSPSGNLVQETDPLGNVWRFLYDSHGNLTATVDPYGNSMIRVYDGESELIKASDFRGNFTEHRYNFVKLLVETVNPLGGTTKTHYDSHGRLTEVVLPSGLEILREYDKLHRVTLESFKGSEPLTLKNKYDVVGNLIEVSENGLLTKFYHDYADRVTTVVDPKGNKIVYEYDALGNVIKVIDQLHRETRYEYDALGRNVRIIYNDGSERKFEYDEIGNLIREIDPEGGVTEYTYDVLNRLIKVKDPLGNITTYSYDALNRVISITDPTGATTYFEYDVKGMYEYDSIGNVTKIQDPEGLITLYFYDADSNATAIVDPLGNVSKFEYNALGKPTLKVDHRGNITKFLYDNAGRIIKVIYPDESFEEFGYDGFGRVTFYKDQEGRKTFYIYDALGRVVEKVYEDWSIRFVYDELGNLIKKIYLDSSFVEYEYDPLGNIKRIAGKGAEILNFFDPMGRVIKRVFKIPGISPIWVEYTYDKLGRKILVKDPFGQTKYTYDPSGRLIQVESDGLKAEFRYDEAGRRVAVKYPNGLVTHYSYFMNTNACPKACQGRLRSIRVLKGEEEIYKAEYEYEGLFIKEKKETDKTTSYKYDNQGQLIQSEVTYDNGNWYKFTYAYDSKGNRVKMEFLSSKEGMFDPRLKRPLDKEPVLKHPMVISYEYDLSSRLVSLEATRVKDKKPSYSVRFKYDPRGSILEKEVIKKDKSLLTRYTYDFDMRLKSVKYPEGQMSEFLILEDFVLRRIFTDEEGKKRVRNIIYDEGQVLLELDESGSPLKRYILSDKIDEILWVKKFKEDGEEGNGEEGGKGKGRGKEKNTKREVIFYHYDHNSVVILTDMKGEVVSKYEYSPFGEVLIAQGPEAKKNVFLFQGREYIPELGAYDMRKRMYSPGYGRFLEVDPILDFSGSEGMVRIGERAKSIQLWHPYVYAENNPVNLRDPTGEYIILCDFSGKPVYNATKEIDKRKCGCVKKKKSWWRILGGLKGCIDRISATVTINCATITDACGRGFHGIDVWIDERLGRARTGWIPSCSGIPGDAPMNSRKHIETLGGIIIHEMVHVCSRGDGRAYGCQCKCFGHRCGKKIEECGAD